MSLFNYFSICETYCTLSEVGIAPGLGPGDRAFEPHYSDQKPSEIVDFRGLSYSLPIAAQEVMQCVNI